MSRHTSASPPSKRSGEASLRPPRPVRCGRTARERRILLSCLLPAILVLAGGFFHFHTSAEPFDGQGAPEASAPGDPPASRARALSAEDFHVWSPQGFGDRQNAWAWSMLWWRDHLYVGLSRSIMCVNYRMFNIGFPFIPYPPEDPDLECAEDPNDLDLAAEIWRWEPIEDIWERVYVSPTDIPIPGTDKYAARDIGYRGFHLFVEPDGTEAMYASGVSARPVQHDEPRPPGARLLRSVDGVHFEPVPQDPGTYLGDLENASFRGMASYKNRLFILAGTYTGPGIILESENPAAGNDAFRKITPSGVRVMELHPYNGFLFLGLRNTAGSGYSVVKTDAEGDPPYDFVTVVPPGAGITTFPSTDILSMVEFKGNLYCGANGIGNDLGSPEVGEEDAARQAQARQASPGEEIRYIRGAEIIRIHPDDSWDLIVGRPRDTPEGFKVPLSGFDSGFNNPFNNHMWRMAVHDGVLYVGTFDSSTLFKESILGPLVGAIMGFDLFASTDGIHFRAVTRNGFGFPLQFGCRNLVSTPYGLFLGTATYYYGTFVFRGVPSL